MFRLVIDTREKSSSTSIITDYLDSINVAYERRNLDTGDLAIYDGDQVVAVFERKTCSDMAASINDGRYREQKMRLLNTDCRWKGYILEGTYPDNGITFPSHGKKRNVAKTTYYSIIAGLSLRDGLLVYTTSNTLETAKLIGQVIRKLPEYNRTIGTSSNYEQELIKSVSTVRKENMTPDVCYLAQLCQIPGISHRIASCIKNKYGNMTELLNMQETDLSQINIGDRRLGKVLASRIIEYMKPNPNPKPKPIITIKRK